MGWRGVCFHDSGEENGYFIYGVYDGFDPGLGIDGNDSKLHNVFSRMSDFYDEIANGRIVDWFHAPIFWIVGDAWADGQCASCIVSLNGR